MFIFKQILKLIRLLHKDEGALLLSIGFSLGVFSGLAGFNSIVGALSLIIALVFRVQIGAYLLSTLVFTFVSLPFFDLFNKIGTWALELEVLRPLWTAMYKQAIFHWLDFNNTLTMGACIFSLLAFLPVLFLSHFLVRRYQKVVLAKIKETKFYKNFMKSAPIVSYQRIVRKLEV